MSSHIHSEIQVFINAVIFLKIMWLYHNYNAFLFFFSAKQWYAVKTCFLVIKTPWQTKLSKFSVSFPSLENNLTFNQQEILWHNLCSQFCNCGLFLRFRFDFPIDRNGNMPGMHFRFYGLFINIRNSTFTLIFVAPFNMFSAFLNQPLYGFWMLQVHHQILRSCYILEIYLVIWYQSDKVTLIFEWSVFPNNGTSISDLNFLKMSKVFPAKRICWKFYLR